jgi:serine/threonine protein kinase
MFDFSESAAEKKADVLCLRWDELREYYLPIRSEDSFWRSNRASKPGEPSQGWKLHVSATVLEACDLFEKVLPFLNSQDVLFKAPATLDDLVDLNRGLRYGYHQVGKFITVYPIGDKQAVRLARSLHKLTKEFFPVPVPFDEQFAPESSVHYRYGAFSLVEIAGENGETYSAIENSSGELVPDDRRKAVPDWVQNPLPKNHSGEKNFAGTPLDTTYRIFRAITQRGKGGTYEAIDLSGKFPRLCIIKEGRQNGELGWNGQDGAFLVRNEFEVLNILKEKYNGVPEVFSSFEVHGNFYFAMECVDGNSLKDIMNVRRRRFSIRRVLDIAVKIAGVIEKIHKAGWVWNDCKPANLIVTKTGSLRPVDFENAHPINQNELFDWRSIGFSRPKDNPDKPGGQFADFFALGAVIYFLLTGKLYDEVNPTPIARFRRNVPEKLIKVTERLLSSPTLRLSRIKKEMEEIGI